MKRILIAVMLIVSVTALSCKQKSVDEATYMPIATLGWQYKNCVIYISDHRGDEYCMQYRLYRSLFYSGGYNKVVKFYYKHPADMRLTKPCDFYGSKSLDADSMARSFRASFDSLIIRQNVYQPSHKEILNVYKARRALYTQYNSSTAKPTL